MHRPAHRAARPLLTLMLALSLSTGLAQAQTQIKSGFNLFSAQDDVQIGAQSAQEAERQLPLMNDAQVNAYVNRIGARLARNAGGPNFPYQFKVVNASDINAFALPGGPIYVNRGVIDSARNEGEVAGVLAHEIAHVALRHGTHQASKAYAAQAGLSILGGILGGKVGNNTAQVLNVIGGVGLNAVFLKFGRDLETQADVRGAQILAASGYAPADMVSFFHTLETVDKSKKTNWLSDHPAPPDRIARIEKEAKLLRVTDQPTTNVADLRAVQSQMGRYGNAPTMADIARTGPQTSASSGNNGPMTSSSGIGNVEAPSRTWRTFTSPSGVYAVKYPSNWQVYQQGSTGVTIAPQGGIGNVGNRTEVVYGAIVNHYDPFGNTPRSYLRGSGSSSSASANLTDATNDLLAQIQHDSPHLRVISNSTQRFNLDGGTALAASLRGTNPNTRIQERVTIITRQLPDQHLVYLLFVTPEQEASQYASVLDSMVRSIQIDDTHRH
ncbi:MAG TPA: M48 family metallopeptidase [Thermoanaerobaculia bacterium]|nr:M48 family metallopeptidase [Thermoanaerobaculia bacterium]